LHDFPLLPELPKSNSFFLTQAPLAHVRPNEHSLSEKHFSPVFLLPAMTVIETKAIKNAAAVMQIFFMDFPRIKFL
jgi:hypothetical protein